MRYMTTLVGKRAFNLLGGSFTYGQHLAEIAGSQIYRIGDRRKTERCAHGGTCQVLDLVDFRREWEMQQRPQIIVTSVTNDEDYRLDALREMGALITVHDFRGFEDNPCLKSPRFKLIAISRQVQQMYPHAQLWRHPYVRRCQNTPLAGRTTNLICHARIDFNKRQADILASGVPCLIRGSVNRAYWKWQLQPTFGIPLPEGFDDPYELLLNSRFCVDFTKMPGGDRGRTQYSWLEAMDAGCIPICHHDWGQCEFQHLSADKTDLASVLVSRSDEELMEMQRLNWDFLKKHSTMEGLTCW